MPDELRSAYAVLGLQPGASLQEVRQQFKNLVRRWHPDRFANDPQGRAEANDRLRVINSAYSTIVQSTAGDVVFFTEALTHCTIPWRGAGDRLTLLYKYAPGHLAWGVGYDELQSLVPLMSERQRRFLQRPAVSPHLPI